MEDPTTLLDVREYFRPLRTSNPDELNSKNVQFIQRRQEQVLSLMYNHSPIE